MALQVSREAVVKSLMQTTEQKPSCFCQLEVYPFVFFRRLFNFIPSLKYGDAEPASPYTLDRRLLEPLLLFCLRRAPPFAVLPSADARVVYACRFFFRRTPPCISTRPGPPAPPTSAAEALVRLRRPPLLEALPVVRRLLLLLPPPLLRDIFDCSLLRD